MDVSIAVLLILYICKARFLLELTLIATLQHIHFMKLSLIARKRERQLRTRLHQTTNLLSTILCLTMVQSFTFATDDETAICYDFTEFCDALENHEEYVTFELTGDVTWNEYVSSSYASNTPISTASIIELTISGNIETDGAIAAATSGEISDEYYAISTTSANDWFAISNNNNWVVTFEDILFQDFQGMNNALSFTNGTLYISNSIFNNESTAIQQAGVISLSHAEAYVSNSYFSNNISTTTGAAFYAQNISTLEVENSIFYNNSTTDTTSSYNAGGGAICIFGSEATIISSQFIENSSEWTGGAIQNSYNNGESLGQSTASKSTLYVYDSAFTSNSATDDGGAIYNYGSYATIINSSFTSNTSDSSGGAIYNYAGSSLYIYLQIYDSEFTENKATVSGGAIVNDWNTASIDGSTFKANSADSGGGAIYNYYAGEMTINDSSFVENTAGTYGGAIYNLQNAVVDITNSSFTKNSAGTAGGAIFNYYATGSVINSVFEDNAATAYAGAIYNAYYSEFTIDDSTFTGNTASSTSSTSYGGAITNTGSSELTITNSSFTGNTATSTSSASYGGAIYNYSFSTLSINNSSFTNNSATNRAGAIYNRYGSVLFVYDSTFTGNSSNYGGAIYNIYGTSNSVNYESIAYIYNSAFTENSSAYSGAAIYNSSSTIYLYESEFIDNVAESGGGAVFNSGGSAYIYDSVFTGNTAGTNGGAIYNSSSGTVYLFADDSDTVFTGNTAGGVSNALYQSSDSSTSYIYASSDVAGSGMVVFNDGISGIGTINVNVDTDSYSGYAGTVILNADMSGFTGSVNIEQGTIVVGASMGTTISSIAVEDSAVTLSVNQNSATSESVSYTNFFAGEVIFGDSTNASSVTLDTGNGVYDYFNTSDWVTASTLSVIIDVGFTTQIADFFDNTDSELTIIIDGFVLSDEGVGESYKIAVAEADSGFSLADSLKSFTTDEYIYTVGELYEDGTYYLVFSSIVVPEPSTATLSLLALTAMLARRRRRCKA